MYTEDVELIEVENDVCHFADVYLGHKITGLSWYRIHGHCPSEFSSALGSKSPTR
jgi:hypothetical protein